MSADDDWETRYEAWEQVRARKQADFIADARATFERKGVVVVESYGNEVRFTSVLTRSARPGVNYQVTDFEDGEPIGHREFEELGAALFELWDVSSPRTKGVPPMPNPRGHRGTQMSGLPVEHARAPEGGPLCGAKPRKWGSLYAQYQDEVTCARCKKKLEEGAESSTRKRSNPASDPEIVGALVAHRIDRPLKPRLRSARVSSRAQYSFLTSTRYVSCVSRFTASIMYP